MDLELIHTAFVFPEETPGRRTLRIGTSIVDRALELAFIITNAPIPPDVEWEEIAREGSCYSLSVGDVVRVLKGRHGSPADSDYYMVAGTGFVKLGGLRQWNELLVRWHDLFRAAFPEGGAPDMTNPTIGMREAQSYWQDLARLPAPILQHA